MEGGVSIVDGRAETKTEKKTTFDMTPLHLPQYYPFPVIFWVILHESRRILGSFLSDLV